MGSLPKVVYLVESPFSQRDFGRFGIETIQRYGFEVEVLDITPVLQPQIHAQAHVPEPSRWEGHRQVRSMPEALARIRGLSPHSFIVCLLGYSVATLPIFRAMADANARYVILWSNIFPSVLSEIPSFRRFLSRLQWVSLKKLMNFLFARIPSRLLRVQPAAVVVLGGEGTSSHPYPVGPKTEYIWAHALDYDVYLRMNSQSVSVDPMLGVFLDEYRPFHPDYAHYGDPAPTMVGNYYRLLRELFDRIESDHGRKIVIAAHPRSHYEKHPDYFGGRTVLRGQTADLVQRAGFAIAHMSLSVNYPVMFRKPVIFVTTEEIRRSFEGPSLEHLASLLGKKPLNLDRRDPLDWDLEMGVDKTAYAAYQRRYIKKPGSPELPLWQIVSDRLRELSGQPSKSEAAARAR